MRIETKLEDLCPLLVSDEITLERTSRLNRSADGWRRYGTR